MKLILSRKGFDGASGKQANPILPDGTLLSLPIPSEDDERTFGGLKWNGKSYSDIISELNPKTRLGASSHCHLDPDLRIDVCDRPNGWKPSFGQIGRSLTTLKKCGVTIGDIFLFLGWFKQTEEINGRLRYVRGTPDLHVIYGYMQVGEIISNEDSVPEWLTPHPHVAYKESWSKNKNAIYIASDKLSIMPELPGSGLLDYRKDRVLTKDGYSRSKWNLPEFFKELEQITYHPNPWVEDYFQSVGRGQEFVMLTSSEKTTADIFEWVKSIIQG